MYQDHTTAGPAEYAGETIATITPRAFAFDSQALRVVEKPDGPWFVAADIAACLGLENPTMMVSPLDPDEKGLSLTYTLGGPQELVVVSESGLYTIALRCRGAVKPGTPAHTFRRWVTHEVLPAIRRTGAYAAAGVDPVFDRAKSLLGLGFSPEQAARILAPVPGARKSTRRPCGPVAPIPARYDSVPTDPVAAADLFHRMACAVLSSHAMPDSLRLLAADWVSSAGAEASHWPDIATSRAAQTSLGMFLRRHHDTIIEPAAGARWRFLADLRARRSTFLLYRV